MMAVSGRRPVFVRGNQCWRKRGGKQSDQMQYIRMMKDFDDVFGTAYLYTQIKADKECLLAKVRRRVEEASRKVEEQETQLFCG